MNFKIKILRTERLTLVPLKKSHAYDLYEGYCEPNIYEFIESDIPPSLEWLEEQFTILEKGEVISLKGESLILYDWVIFENKSNKAIGRSEYTIYPNGKCNVAYTLFPEFWRQGYAVEATKACLAFLNNHPAIVNFIIACDTWNIASNRIAHKLGFKLIGIDLQVNKLKNRIGDDNIYESLNKNRVLEDKKLGKSL